MLNILTSFNSTYYGKDYRAGAALLRARRPFLVKNALTGFGLFAFTIGVCTLLLPWSPRPTPSVPLPACRVLPWSQLQPSGATRHLTHSHTLRTSPQDQSADN